MRRTVSKLCFHPWNLCAPPASFKTWIPGLKLRWYVLFKMRFIPSDSTCCGVKPLIAACVATGMKVGNIVTPSREQGMFFLSFYLVNVSLSKHNLRASFILETRAFVVGHFAMTSNCMPLISRCTVVDVILSESTVSMLCGVGVGIQVGTLCDLRSTKRPRMMCSRCGSRVSWKCTPRQLRD